MLMWGANEMTEKPPKRPRDSNQLAKLMIDIASRDEPETEETKLAQRARTAGKQGGPARARSLTPEQRTEIARTAAMARWKKKD